MPRNPRADQIGTGGRIKSESPGGCARNAHCFAGVGPHVNRAVHICCGYPASLDDPHPAKSDSASYFALSSALDAADVDAVSIEDAHRHNDLKLLELFGHTTIILGLIDIANSHVESVPGRGNISPSRHFALPNCRSP